jgi:hypothetical protein
LAAAFDAHDVGIPDLVERTREGTGSLPFRVKESSPKVIIQKVAIVAKEKESSGLDRKLNDLRIVMLKRDVDMPGIMYFGVCRTNTG